MRPERLGRFALIAGVAILMASPALAQQAPPPRQVGVVEMRLQEVPRVVTLPGRAVATEETAIRPRVAGMITEILYRGGTPLTAGAPMFRIDTTTYEAQVMSAEADIAAARAAVALATSDYERRARLVGSATTQAELETAQATLEQAEAQLKVAEAAMRVAQAELGWTIVTSPIDGMASVANVSVGDLVTVSQTDPLATVTRLDPIDVDMYEPWARMLGVIDDIQAGRLQPYETLRAKLKLESGQTYDTLGEFLAPGFVVSTSTGSVDHRFRFQNPDQRLLPGMFLRGSIEVGVSQAFLVSQSAATRDRTGKLTAFVVEDGKTAQRVLTDDGTWQNNWIVTDGIEEGDLLVADGLMGLTAGMDVVTVPVEYDADGVVRAIEPGGGSPESAPTSGESTPSEPAADESAPATE